VRADRLVSLVLLLQARGTMTGRELASELEVSVRTVYRDLAALSSAGVPVLAEAGPGGGCRLLDGYRFPLRGLRPEEAEALLILGVPGALRELGLDVAAQAAHRQIRVTAGLTDGTAGPGGPGPAAAAALVYLDMPRWFRSPEQVPQLRVLAEAVRQRRLLEFRYDRGGGSPDPAAPGSRAAGTGPQRRVVAPLGLVNKAGTWYLVGVPRAGPRYSPGRAGGITVFRAGRVTSARVLAEPAGRPDGFDLAGFWEQWAREFAASRPRLRVRLRASPPALAAFGEVFGDEAAGAVAAGMAPGEDGWQELTLTFEHELAAAYRLAGFGGQVKILSPVTVRERLLAAARGILDRYDTDPARPGRRPPINAG
jgi:predicted DNA-binding transcriptional regulator YafY